MDFPELGPPMPQQRLDFTTTMKLVTNVRDDYLRRALGDSLSDYIRKWCDQWTKDGHTAEPKYYVRFHSMIGPVMRHHGEPWENAPKVPEISADEEIAYLREVERSRVRHPTNPDYQPEIDPYQGESAARYEEGDQP